jgi:hypothetical protein
MSDSQPEEHPTIITTQTETILKKKRFTIMQQQ